MDGSVGAAQAGRSESPKSERDGGHRRRDKAAPGHAGTLHRYRTCAACRHARPALASSASRTDVLMGASVASCSSRRARFAVPDRPAAAPPRSCSRPTGISGTAVPGAAALLRTERSRSGGREHPRSRFRRCRLDSLDQHVVTGQSLALPTTIGPRGSAPRRGALNDSADGRRPPWCDPPTRFGAQGGR